MVVFPNAKINIGLFVTEKRPDGFHNLETVFYPVGLSDILEVLPEGGKRGHCRFVNTGLEIGGDARDNLVVKAYHLLFKAYGLPSVYVHLHKLIPFGAGLGGGSADAAFMIKALNSCFDLALSEEVMMEYAATLGSDCAFFIRNRPALGKGKGEILEEITLDLQGYRLVIVKPDFGVPTAEAYQGIVPQPASLDLHTLGKLPVEQWKEQLVNDFEKTVFTRYPVLAALKQELYQAGAVYASLTGSGSALYGLFRKEEPVELNFPGCFVWQG